MEVEIGDAAGTIWRYLDENGETTLTKLKHGAKLPEQTVLMAIGWLAREGKLRLSRERRGLKVDLREGQPA